MYMHVGEHIMEGTYMRTSECTRGSLPAFNTGTASGHATTFVGLQGNALGAWL